MADSIYSHLYCGGRCIYCNMATHDVILYGDEDRCHGRPHGEPFRYSIGFDGEVDASMAVDWMET